MKILVFIFFSFSIITFRSCGELEAHEDVIFEINPVYSGGVLSLTPVIHYQGEEDMVFKFGSSIGRIDKVKSEEDTLYEYKGEAVEVDQRSTLEKGEERAAMTVDLNVEHGMFDVYMVAEYFLVIENDSGEEELIEYYHELVKTIELQ